MATNGGISLLADALRAALARLPASTGLVHYPIWAEWTATVGPTIAAHTKPAQLRRGVLVVTVDGPEWMHELQYMKRELCAKLNARLGTSAIRDIYLVLTTG
jgi:predicted nucleic acid-binding Zn ribbon protein